MPSTPSAAEAAFAFYDIESLENVFTVCSYQPRHPEGPLVEMFYRIDDGPLKDQLDQDALHEMLARTHKENPALPTGVRIIPFDLTTWQGLSRLAALLGVSDASPWQDGDMPADLKAVTDTDADYDWRVHPFLAGYNSAKYDLTMLARFFADAYDHQNLASARDMVTTAAKTFADAKARKDTQDAEDAFAMFKQVQGELDALPPMIAPTAAQMRHHNNALFTRYSDYMPAYLERGERAHQVYWNFMRSGRHIDVSRFNELQAMVSLKRLLGMIGRQIMESDRLNHDSTLESVEDFIELMVYNVADCVGLANLMEHPVYSGGFDLKAGLLYEYDETRFDKEGNVRRDRLSIDSTSSKFVGRILAPGKPLEDIETVSFMYPHPEIAAQTGVASQNILQMCDDFFRRKVAPDWQTDPRHREAMEQFRRIVNYYRRIEGQNFNDSERYRKKYPNGPRALNLSEVPKEPNNICYFGPGAKPTSCFVTFSTGGIHGAEANVGLLQAQQEQYGAHQRMLEAAQRLFPAATDFVACAKTQHGSITLPDGQRVLKSAVVIGSDPATARWRKPKAGDEEQNRMLAAAQAQCAEPADVLALQRPAGMELDVVTAGLENALPTDPDVIEGKAVLAVTTAKGATYRLEPAVAATEMFPALPNGATKLAPKLARTSAGMVIHEDFASYYPNLLRNMRAFYNPELGEDRYAMIFEQKEQLGRQMKDPNLDEATRQRLEVLRNGTKLILNSASGAGDATHDTPIRMNNAIISMRIIGQLFSWMIGQAQTLAGARIISTNTDGLYSVLSEDYTAEENNRVLAEISAAINITIDPEPMVLISKDSNNRLELGAPRGQDHLSEPEAVMVAGGRLNLEHLVPHAAGGGTLACFRGPNPTKSLSHPAAIDAGLAAYLQHVVADGEQALAKSFDWEVGWRIIADLIDPSSPVHTLAMFQTMVTASRGSITYPVRCALTEDPEEIVDPAPMQMVNRVLIVRSGTEGAVSLRAAAAHKVSAQTLASRRAKAEKDPGAGVTSLVRDPLAMEQLRHHGWASTTADTQLMRGASMVPEDRDIVFRKVPGISPAWPVLVVNQDLHEMDPAEQSRLIGAIDVEVYTQMLASTFEKNWMNVTP